MHLLALDVSTSVIGVAIFDIESEAILYSDAILLKKIKDDPLFIEKIKKCREYFEILLKDYQITSIFIEEPLAIFRKGHSSAGTIQKLNFFNGMICSLLYFLISVPYVHINARVARSSCGITINKKENAKEKCLEFVLDKYADFRLTRTRKGNVKQHYYDIADAIVVGNAALLIVKK